ncbi:MAG: tail fiber domain-containing protein, partial [Bacteroidia bacterium]|nr:tail fiber domain-containing protein [Bacteroidia bacterium]
SYFLKVEMDPAGGDAFQLLGTSQLLSVPYALHARTVETGDNWGKQGVISDASLSGKGTASSPIGLSQNGASKGQVLKYSGSTWIPSDDKAGGLILPYADSTTLGSKETVLKLTCYGDTWSSAITGISKSSNGTGVIGEGAFGVWGNSNVPGGTGMRGTNSPTTGSGWGLSGVANSSGSGGIWGSGGLYGVKADAGSPSGYGIYGTASSSTGITYAVYGRVYSPEGYAGYFKGGKFHVSGRVGIGTESPSAGLHLKGNGYPESFIYLEANTGQDAGFRLYEGSVAKWHIFNSVGAGGLHIYNDPGQTAIFAKQSNSYIGINTTEPTQSLDVNGNARFRSIGSGAYAGAVNRTSDGTLTTSTSDGRLKENVQSLENSLDKVMLLRGVSFTWKTNPEYGKRIGFIAQEFEKVIPDLVFTNEADGYKGINYAEVSAVLVEAIKELKAENDRLKSENGLNQTKIESLEGRLSKLERMLD